MQATPESVWEFILKLGEEIKALSKEIAELKERFKETDERFKDTDKQFKETDKKIRELSNLFTTQWGKLVEALVEPGVLELFQKRGIDVYYASTRVRKKDKDGRVLAEIDILLEDEREAVVVEVKTTVTPEDVDEFLEKLSKFKKIFSKYRDYRVYGAIAGISFDKGSDRYAYKQGLFVLRSKGGVIEIANDEKFKPKVW